MDKFFKIIATIIVLWFVGSYIEVITHNGPDDTGYEYSEFNMFVMIANS